MNNLNSFGFYLYQKDRQDLSVLKEMLQFLKSHSKGKSPSFAYLESETSLIPHLTLWENIHIVSGGKNWKDFCLGFDAQWSTLTHLIAKPDCLASDADPWERLAAGLIKAILIPTPNLIVDMNEDLHSPLNLQHFKNILLQVAEGRHVYMASANISLWLDSSHSLVTKNGYQFQVSPLDTANLKIKRAA